MTGFAKGWRTIRSRNLGVDEMTANVRSETTQELLLGTWQAIGLIGDALVRSGAIRRAELLEPLAIAAALTHSLDRRHVAFGAVHGLINSAADGEEVRAAGPCSGRVARPLRRGRTTGERRQRLWSHACRPDERNGRR
jgi:hypothetical protein